MSETTEETPDEKLPRKLPHSSADAAAEALEQAHEYQSLFAPTPLELDGDSLMIPPHPDYGMLDDDRLDAYDQLLFDVDTVYDREEDIYIPESEIKNSEGVLTGVKLPSSVQRGAIKRPFRINNERVSPPYSVRVVQIALGEQDYKRLIEGGRSSKDVWKIWGDQNIRIEARRKGDSKSAAGAVPVASISPADS